MGAKKDEPVPMRFPEGNALCVADPESWHPIKGDYDHRAAILVCMDCELQQPCLEWALANRETGIWGGTTEKTRKRMLRKAAQ